MALWKCEMCGDSFKRDRAGDRVIRFCGSRCYNSWQKGRTNAGTFRSGHEPHNKGVKGIHYSPVTEFKKGQANPDKLPIGAVTIRRDKAGKDRAWVKVSNDRVRGWVLRAVVVWERENGKLLSGMVVHHKDHTYLNDSPLNLEAVTRSRHIAIHRQDLVDAKKRIHADAPLFGEVL